jgi:hypothetical protein
VAKLRIVGHGDGLGLQAQAAEEAESETADFDRATEAGRQPREQGAARPAVVKGQRQAKAREQKAY